MSTARFLNKLRQLGIELRVSEQTLLVDAPKGAVSQELADEIRRRKTEVLEFLRMGVQDGASAPPGARIGCTGSAASGEASGEAREAHASFGQRRLFYLDQLDPGLAVYNVPVAYWLRGELDLGVLHRAIDEIVRRHGALRTTLALDERGVVQRVAPHTPLSIARIDIDGDTTEERERRCRELLSEHARVPFDLTSGPLLRVLLFRLQEDEHVLFVVTHHVVTDGWSQDIFETELLAQYDAARRGAQSSLPELPIQYVDYATWQTLDKDDPERQRRVDEWRERLRAPLPILELPTTHTRPNDAPTAGETESLRLSHELIEPLTALGRREGATLFMVLLAGYATLLNRLSGQNEIVIGTPIANRTQAETLDLIGYFANTLALRIDLSGSPTFRDVLGRVRDVCTAAYASQDIPFEELVEVLEIERDLSRSPIFQTIFAFEDAMPRSPRAISPSGGLRVERRHTVHAKVARTDLSAWVSAASEGLEITLEYPTALFDADAIRRFLGHFTVLLSEIASAPDRAIAALPILSPEERGDLLRQCEGTAKPIPDVPGAHVLFERRADAQPDRTAVVLGSESITYGDLDRRANRLAHHLCAQGGAQRPTQRPLVGIFLERSIDMVVALLAVLKSGAAYVPLDPDYPAERLAHMVKDSALTLVITTEALASRLPSDRRLVCLDRQSEEIAAQPDTRPTAHSPSDTACYVIYTSGSTGLPKGVVVQHLSLLNFLCSMSERPGMTSDDTLVAVTTLSFDIAGLEIFLPLVMGAKLVLASRDEATDGAQLSRLLESSRATVMQATPSTWRLLVGAGWRADEPRADGERSRFKALCGGEALPRDLGLQLIDRVDEIWNMYGPTETTIWSTCVSLGRHDPQITIGKPIDNTSVYILGPLGQLQPIGVPGELVIGGLGVAEGYLQRPELTAQRFVADPFSSRPDARMYRTGDLAAYRADGEIVYHRRLDHQVKVRGHRIELGEIEAVLAEHVSIASCVVVVREDRPGDTRLVAYYVAKSGSTVTATDLRKQLRKKLPEYMVPQHFVDLPDLPLTPAKKVDRRQLPAPAGVGKAVFARAPETASERLVARVWADALGSDRIAASDNFFDLGGHSLLSMAVIARLNAETGSRVNPRDLLLSSLEQIAGIVGTAPRAPSEPTISIRDPQPAKARSAIGASAPDAGPSVEEAGVAKSFVSRIKGKLFG